MTFSLLGRYFGLSPTAHDDDAGGAGPILRWIAYGVGGILLAGLLGLALLVVVGRKSPPPPRLAEALRAHPLPAPVPAPAPAVAPRAGPSAADPAAVQAEEELRGVRQQVEQEAATVVALHDQLEEARRDLAELQRQQDEARRSLTDAPRPPAPERPQAEKAMVERAPVEKPAMEKPAAEKPAVERMAVEKPAINKPEPEKLSAEQRRGVERRVPDRLLPETAVSPRAQPPAPAASEADGAERPAPPRPPVTPELDRALGRLRTAMAVRAEDGLPPGRSPPPAILGQIPATLSDFDAIRPAPDTAPSRVATAAPPPAGPAARRRVFLYYRNGSAPGETNAADLAQRLLFSDFAYAETRNVPASTPKPVIRYYYREDAEPAGRLADLLRGSGTGFRVLDASGTPTRAARGTLEVWIP